MKKTSKEDERLREREREATGICVKSLKELDGLEPAVPSGLADESQSR